MGSGYVVKVVGADLPDAQWERIRAEVDLRLQDVNRQMSHYQPDSELSRFNRGAAGQSVPISAGFAQVLRFALELNRRSDRAFDPTLGSLINLWGFGERPASLADPQVAAFEVARRNTGCQHLSLLSDRTLVKSVPGLELNLGGVAKGFGVDEIVRVLEGHGLSNVYAAIAGEVRVLGHNAQGTNWQVGIAAPVAHWRESDPMATVLSLTDCGLSTSGDYQKFRLGADGKRLSHILDPRTGRPVQSDVASVSVVAADGMTADGLATTLFVLGLEEGLKLVDGWTNAGALFIVRRPDGRFETRPSARFGALTGYQP